MLQVGKIALTKADDPVHFFYLLYITKELEGITGIAKRCLWAQVPSRE